MFKGGTDAVSEDPGFRGSMSFSGVILLRGGLI